MQVHRAHHQIEALRRERQELFVGYYRRPARAAGKAMAEVQPHQALHGLAWPERRGDFIAMRADVEGEGKAAAHVVQTLDQALGDLAFEEGSAIPIARCPLTPAAKQDAVEDQERVGGRHARVCRAKVLRPVGEPPSCRRISTV